MWTVHPPWWWRQQKPPNVSKLSTNYTVLHPSRQPSLITILRTHFLLSTASASTWTYIIHFTFMLPCIIIDFFLNNQPSALIIPILFCYKTLHVSGIFSAHHQEFSTVHSALVNSTQASDDCFQAGSGWNSGVFYCTFSTAKYHADFWWPLPSRARMELSSILTLLGSGHQKPAWILPVPNVQ
jgi:hypothetical protein